MTSRQRILLVGALVVALMLAGGMVAIARPELRVLDVGLPWETSPASAPAAAVRADPLINGHVEFFVKPGGDDANYCDSWEYACETIQGAIDLAYDDDVINVAVGSYAESIVVGKVLTIIGGQQGESPTSPLQPPQPTVTEILGTPGGPPVVVKIDGVVLENLTLGSETQLLNGEIGCNCGFGVLLCLGSSDLDLRNVTINFPVEVQIGHDGWCEVAVKWAKKGKAE